MKLINPIAMLNRFIAVIKNPDRNTKACVLNRALHYKTYIYEIIKSPYDHDGKGLL